jgi:hypothetical protein
VSLKGDKRVGQYRYMLRKTLAPWRFKETIDEVKEFCQEFHIDEVIWKVDAEDFNHGITPLSIIKEFIPWLGKARDELSEIGVAFSINPWVTHNHSDRGRDMRKVHPGMEFCLDWTGLQSKACACSLSRVWRDWLSESYRLYASTKPSILWVEDDIRTYNHSPVSWGCFCPAHLRLFSERVGLSKTISREELIKAILAPGKPHPWRGEWMRMLSDIMIQVVSELERAVHEVSPETRLGLMSSSPDHHAAEGRRWEPFVRALSGKHRPVCRPHLPPYSEDFALILIPAADIVRETVYCLPKDTQICPELENMTFTRFAKSVRFSRLQIGISALMGFSNITMNLYDHIGTPIFQEPQYGEMLKEVKPKLESIISARTCLANKDIGVRLIHSDEASTNKHLEENASYSDLIPYARGWSSALQSIGYPITFNESPITAVTGDVLRSMSHEKLYELLSKGLLIDASAALALEDMGYGEKIGASVERIFQKDTMAISAEEYFNPKFGGEKERYMTLTGVGADRRLAKLAPREGSIIVSKFVDPDRIGIMPGMVAYENDLGGRIIQYAADFSKGSGVGFLNWTRAHQLTHVLDWLGCDNTMVRTISGPYLFTVCTEYEGGLFLGVANLSTDSAPNLQFRLKLCEDKKVTGVKSISKEIPRTSVTYHEKVWWISCEEPLDIFDFTALIIEISDL